MAEPLISGLVEQLFSITEVERLVKKDVDKLSSNLAAAQAVLVDAEERQFSDDSVREWLEKLQDLCYEADGVFDKWRTAFLKSETEIEEAATGLSSEKVFSCVPSSCFSPLTKSHPHRMALRRDIALEIKELNQRLDRIIIEKERYMFAQGAVEQEGPEITFPFPTWVSDETEIHGREMEKEILICRLVSEGSKDKAGLNTIIPIVGMGGIGKTTLAQLVFNDDKVTGYFEYRIWVNVGASFDLIEIAKVIIKTITDFVPNLFELESLLELIYNSIHGKRFLLVLDDVWTDDEVEWERLNNCLKHGAVGSRILVTTRKEKVAIMMGAETSMICLEHLSEEFCWRIFSNLAYSERNTEECKQLEEIGRRIAGRSKGLPLLAKILGSLMRLKTSKEQWEAILDSKLWELEYVKNHLFVVFLLSYYDLPPLEKRHLLYCSIFPKDVEIDRDDLIELWMSQGYLDDSKISRRGEHCFESLALRSFFQDFRKSFYGNITTCMMHDIMHDFLQFLTKNKWFQTWDVSSPHETTWPRDESTRHITLLLNSGAQIPIPIYDKKKLRTLFVKCSETSSTLLNVDLVPELACLRTLYLRGCRIQKLPAKIDKLMYLRYLNLSDNSYLKELPNELCNLLNLQTLKLNSCIQLRILPDGMGKLVKLRHLYIDGCHRLQELPKGISERVASLWILDMFVVSCDNLEINKAMKLGDLNRLKDVKGCLHIFGIGDVADAGDAEKAQLKEKQNLVGLKLNFSQGTWPRRTEEESAVLLEALEPHPNLQSLTITEYNGATFSKWMLSLINLRRLVLSGCPNCVFLPPLGRLPSLETLRIEGMTNVKKVGPEFLGLLIMETDESETTGVESSFVSFPKLKELYFGGLKSWEEWFGGGSSSMMIMPCLRSLRISFCNLLKGLPDFMANIAFQDFRIVGCAILEEHIGERMGHEWPNISQIPNIPIDGSEIGVFSANEETESSQKDEISPA